jgi:hypothetical protein
MGTKGHKKNQPLARLAFFDGQATRKIGIEPYVMTLSD